MKRDIIPIFQHFVCCLCHLVDYILSMVQIRLAVMLYRYIWLYLVISHTLWSYKLILNHLLKYRTKFHYIYFVWPLTPSSLMDIWHLVSNKQVICKKCLEMAIRKKVRFLGLAQIYLFLMDKFLKKRNFWQKSVYYWFEG